MQFPGFIGPSYTLRSVNVDCQRCINLYPELNEIGTGKNAEIASLVSTPGLKLAYTLGSGPIRGMHRASTGRCFAVSGNTLYDLTGGGVAVAGALLTNTGLVGMADNATQLVVTDGLCGYILPFAGRTLSKITDPDFPGADTVGFLDGYFIFNNPGTQQFFISNINDGTDYNALDFASSEALPDNLISVLVDHRELWLFNDISTEIWFNSGAADFPFSRIQGAFVEHGIDGAFTAQKLDNGVMWLSKDKNGYRMVMRAARDYGAQRMSTFAVERSIQQYTGTPSAWTYQDGGHTFYALNFSDANTTWVCDVSLGPQGWHERAYLKNGSFTRHRAQTHVFDGTRHLVGDFENGNVYQLDENTYDDNGNPKKWLRRSPHISANMEPISYPEFRLDMETGVGLTSGQGSDPQVMMRFSDDGGHTWSNERWTASGQQGQFKHHAVWRKNGSSRNRVWEVSGTDPVKTTLISAFFPRTQASPE